MCGATFDYKQYKWGTADIREAISKKICFECLFWERFAVMLHQTIEVINGKVYQIEKIQKQDSGIENDLRSNIKNKCYIMYLENKTVEQLNRAVYIGIPPEKYKSKFPNTAIFIKKSTYLKLTKCYIDCDNKGCWDRYHCFQYNIAKEKEPWNVVPKYHKIGNENCPCFINKNDL